MASSVRRHWVRWIMAAAFICLFAARVSGQTVQDPSVAEFDPSPDHATLDSSGTPIVSSYALSFFAIGGLSPVMTIDLGKPSPDSDGKIRIDFTELTNSLPPGGVTYEARVSAVGAGGSAASGLSNQFTFSAPCDPSISPVSQSLTSAAGSGTVTVTAAGGCGWTAVSTASWLTVTSGASGSGNGSVGFSAAANTAASQRNGTINIGGEVFTVTQAGTSCSYTISPTSQTIASSGGTGTITLTTTSSCGWSASSTVNWISITSGASGTGNGSVGFSVLANAATSSRTGTIIAGGKTFTVTQSAASSSCSFTVSPASVTMSSSAGSSSVTVTTTSSCAWSATESASWLSISNGTGRTGGGTLSFSATANTTGSKRSATMTVAGKAVVVTQNAPATPSITVSPTSINVAASGNFRTTAHQLAISQGAGNPVNWTITANQSWLQITPSSGTGTALVAVSLKSGVTLPTAATTATVTVTPTGATARTVQVKYTPIGTGGNPFGAFDTPTNNTTGVTGSIPVTGWALDDIDIARVRVLRDSVSGEAPGTQIFIGNAVLVEAARPDVAKLHPTLPHSTRAGWGLLVLTNMLPNQGNGTFRLHAYADDVDGHTVLLGSRTITCTNSTATAPFGAIDTPGQGETISGTNFANFGWVLSRGTRRADPPGGGNVRVVIDGAFVGSPAGWTNRSDISTLFPLAQYSGVRTAVGVYPFNTRTLTDGVHTIAWVVTDNQGGSAGIGSRYFSVLNGGTSSLMSGVHAAEPEVASASLAIAEPVPSGASVAELNESASQAVMDPTPIYARRGYAESAKYRAVRPDASGLMTMQAEETDRLEMALQANAGDECSGYSVTAGVTGALPVGSTIDPATCVFTWQAGVGFVGSYDLVFLRKAASGVVARQDVRVVLNPKRSGLVGPQVVIDIPGADQVVGQAFVVAGWAADLDSEVGTGVDTLHVWAYPAGTTCNGATCDPIFLGVAAYGGIRPDVGAIYGNQFRASGYGLSVDSLPAGTYDVAVFAWSTVTGNFVPASTARVTVK